MNDLYLIGNGFDLAHGLKTSYNDFLLWYLKTSLSKIMPNRHYEDELITFKKYYSDPLSDHKEVSSLLKECEELQINIDFKHSFFETIVQNVSVCKWVDIEYQYYQYLINIYDFHTEGGNFSSYPYIQSVALLNVCMEAIKRKLIEYLSIVDYSSKEQKIDIRKIINAYTGIGEEYAGEKMFLYFNYTSTLEIYRETAFFDDNNLIHIHGELNNNSNPIIFGYGDEIDPHYKIIENLNSNELLKNIKSFGYFRTSNYQRFLRYVDSNEFVVKILGHSCGISDRILLNTIFEHENCKAIKIYYHKKNGNENDFFEKTQEISRHFQASGKGDMRRKIVSFEESQPLCP